MIRLMEVAYPGNMGFEEIVRFYKIASDSEIKQLERLMQQEKYRESWQMVQQKLNMKLKGREFK